MPAFLLTWNSDHYSLDNEGAEGHEINWSCSSKQPQTGDTVYLVRIGSEPRGIVAKGTVTKESFQFEDFNNPDKLRSGIRFRFDDLRLKPSEGPLSMLMLQSRLPEQRWNPQSSGITIKPDSLPVLDDLWHLVKDQHLLKTLLHDVYEQTPHESWLKRIGRAAIVFNPFARGRH